MAAAGKKGKKAKWIPANITDILSEPTTIPTTPNWADSVDDEPESFGYGSRTRAAVVLPSASRAARGGMAVDDDAIPRRPPYVAYISNLPYDVDESAITELFAGLKIQNLRLPREGDRLKGFGYVDFEDRESLIEAMNIADLTISGRRIRIEVSTQENDRRMGNRRGGDRERDYDPERTTGDWRSGPRVEPEPTRGTRPPDRERMRERERDSSPSEMKPGAWRDGDRPAAEPARTPYGGRDSYGRDRFEERDRDRGFGGESRDRGYGGREGFREAERSYGRDGFRSGGDRDRDRFSRDGDRGAAGAGAGGRGFSEWRGFGDRDKERDRDPPREDARPRERPKLNLLPRTVPRDSEEPATLADGAQGSEERSERPAPKAVPAESVFGAAKPVDTAAKEREIEERLKRQEEEARRGTDDRDNRWGRRNDDSGDRRGPRRNDEPRGGSRESRTYRDRRDYSKDDKDREYSRDNRDRGSKERDSDYSRDKRDFSKENTNRDRDYSRDNRDSRDRDGRGSRDGDDRRDPRDAERRDSRDGRNDKDTRDVRNEKDTRDVRNEQDSRDTRDGRTSRDGRDDRDRYSRDGKDYRDDRDRRGSRDRDEKVNRNGSELRPSRSIEPPQDSGEREERPLPKLKEQEPPNFAGSNKFSFLEDGDSRDSD